MKSKGLRKTGFGQKRGWEQQDLSKKEAGKNRIWEKKGCEKQDFG